MKKDSIVCVRLSADLRERIAARAERERRPLSNLIRLLLERQFSARPEIEKRAA